MGSNGNGNDGKHGKNERNGTPSNSSHESHQSHDSHDSPSSHGSHSSQPLLPRRGDYRTLLSYQKSEVIYEITFRFCHRFLARNDRTFDQMVQAARSGKQNIVEGSKAGTASKESEIKLTNVARASLEELLEDYRDFLRLRDLPIWDKDSRQARFVRDLGTANPLTFEPFREFVATRPAEVVANIAICLTHQANYLLDRQIHAMGEAFLRDGGLRERMTRARLQARQQEHREGDQV